MVAFVVVVVVVGEFAEIQHFYLNLDLPYPVDFRDRKATVAVAVETGIVVAEVAYFDSYSDSYRSCWYSYFDWHSGSCLVKTVPPHSFAADHHIVAAAQIVAGTCFDSSWATPEASGPWHQLDSHLNSDSCFDPRDPACLELDSPTWMVY